MANADVFRSMSGNAGPGTPSYAEPREPSVDATVTPAPAKSLRAGFYRGDGGYEYIVGPQGEVTIANSPNARGIGTVVEVDSPFYDDIATELAGKQDMVSGIPAPVAQRLAQAKASKKAGPKATVIPGGVEGMEIETPAPMPAAAPPPEMAETEYEDTLLAAPQGSKVPPPPERERLPLGGMGSKRDTLSKELSRISTPGLMGSRPGSLVKAAGEAFDEYRSGVRVDSDARSVITGLTQNGMDAQAAKQFVNGLKDQGPTGASVLRNLAASFFDERLNTATGKKYGK